MPRNWPIAGIAGTRIFFSFYAAAARWLVDRWPGQIQIDWEELENTERLENYLAYLVSYSETPAIDNVDLEFPDWINRLKGPNETDAAFLIRRLARITSNEFLRDAIYEEIGIPLTVVPGPDTPSRTRCKYGPAPVIYQTVPLAGGRPSIAEEGAPAVAARSGQSHRSGPSGGPGPFGDGHAASRHRRLRLRRSGGCQHR